MAHSKTKKVDHKIYLHGDNIAKVVCGPDPMIFPANGKKITFEDLKGIEKCVLDIPDAVYKGIKLGPVPSDIKAFKKPRYLLRISDFGFGARKEIFEALPSSTYSGYIEASKVWPNDGVVDGTFHFKPGEYVSNDSILLEWLGELPVKRVLTFKEEVMLEAEKMKVLVEAWLYLMQETDFDIAFAKHHGHAFNHRHIVSVLKTCLKNNNIDNIHKIWQSSSLYIDPKPSIDILESRMLRDIMDKIDENFDVFVELFDPKRGLKWLKNLQDILTKSYQYQGLAKIAKPKEVSDPQDSFERVIRKIVALIKHPTTLPNIREIALLMYKQKTGRNYGEAAA